MAGKEEQKRETRKEGKRKREKREERWKMSECWVALRVTGGKSKRTNIATRYAATEHLETMLFSFNYFYFNCEPRKSHSPLYFLY